MARVCTHCSPVHEWGEGPTPCPEIGPLLYPLKRYADPTRPTTAFGLEAGYAYEDRETGEEVIRCAGTWYPDGQPVEYRYPSGAASATDGWQLD